MSITGDVGTAAFNPKYLFAPQSLFGDVAGDLMNLASKDVQKVISDRLVRRGLPAVPENGDAVFEGDKLAAAGVQAEIVEHLRGPKLRVFKFKPKRGYKRRYGHRQDLTRLEIADIKVGAARRATKQEDDANGS